MSQPSRPRVASTIASATEIVCALGAESMLVARSHECDYPAGVRALPAWTRPKLDIHASGTEIDVQVKNLAAAGQSVYEVDADLLCRLRPDVILTQRQCEVCAVSDRDVDIALTGWMGTRPKVVTLSPEKLADLWDNIESVAEALGLAEKGRELVRGLHERLDNVRARAGKAASRPRVACLEWIEPLMAAGNWVPELVELAGGVCLFGQAGKHAPWLTWDKLRRADPDIIMVMPCGFDLERTQAEMRPLLQQHGWNELIAVASGRVFLTDGNQYFNRPGPRLVDSLEILAELFHPALFPATHGEPGWRRLGSRQS